MTESSNCPQCGRAVAGDAPQGLCPACLLKRGLETNTLDASAGPASRWTPPSIEQLAPLFPELDILELIGRGGMGAVYKARQKDLDRLVALKILPPEIGRDASLSRSFADRFTREAQAMARLSHPNIVTIHAFGRREKPLLLDGRGQGEGDSPLPPGERTVGPACPPRVKPGSAGSAGSPSPVPAAPEGSAGPPSPARGEGLYFFLMEYIDGLSLRQILDTGNVDPAEALAIVPQICDALQYAHDRGIVHRDIKPENILLNRAGQVKIADFGLAKLVGRDAGVPPARGEAVSASSEAHSRDHAAGDTRGRDARATEAHRVLGTPRYMAPEQVERPGEVDHRADIYSLGVVFYQMLTGELPRGSSTKEFAPPSRKVQIDVRLDEVVLRALQREPARRYQQVSEVKTEVETIAAHPSPLAGEDARRAGEGSGRAEEGLPQRSEAKPGEGTPRMSRLAILGAIWAAFGLLGLLLIA